jgi:hypothetical protein
VQTNEEEQMIKRGDNAEVLLGTDAFTDTINTMVESTFQAFCNTKPDETETRERTYSHYRALVDIVSTLQQQVSVRNEINAKNERDNNEEVE